MFGLVGIEMSAVHADEVTEPQKAYPKAILWSMGCDISEPYFGYTSTVSLVAQCRAMKR